MCVRDLKLINHKQSKIHKINLNEKLMKWYIEQDKDAEANLLIDVKQIITMMNIVIMPFRHVKIA